jgi:hypothetical protein
MATMDIPLALTMLSKSLEVLKAIRDIDKDFDEASYKAKIAELMNSVADAKIALIDAREELAAREKEIARLKDGLKFREDHTIIVQGRRYEKASNGQPIGMPFCDRCDTVDGLLIRIAETLSKDGYVAICPQCKANYGSARALLYPYLEKGGV